MLGGSYEEAHLLPTACNIGLRLDVPSYAIGAATVVALADAARQHFGGVFDEPRWAVDVGELTRIADRTLSEAAEVYETVSPRRNDKYLSARSTTDSVTENRFSAYQLSATELLVEVCFLDGESSVPAKDVIASSAEFIIGIDRQHALASAGAGDGWTGGYRWMVARGTADRWDFLPYAWMFLLTKGLIDPAVRFRGVNYDWHELSSAGVLCWWTGGSTTEFWTGDARVEQRDLLGDLFPTRDPIVQQMVTFPFHHHVLEVDLEPS